jgi:rsbT co-antagonist protein RsbR
MTLDELKELVVGHLADVIGGECSISQEELEKQSDPAICEILAGILCLHEDLRFKERERARAEASEKAMIAQLQERQKQLEELTAELSTPLIVVSDGALLLPIVGTVDTTRAQEMTDKALSEIRARNVRHVILDLTGVQTMDVSTAEHLVRIVSAIRLLGSSAIVAGAQPGVASAIVHTGVDLKGIVTVRNVQAALKRCLADGAV